jgi:hypothetical protein
VAEADEQPQAEETSREDAPETEVEEQSGE